MDRENNIFRSVAGEVLQFPSTTAKLPDSFELSEKDEELAAEVKRLARKMIKCEVEYTAATVNYHKAVAAQQISLYKKLQKINPVSAKKYMDAGKRHAELANDIQNVVLIAGFKPVE